MLQFTKRPIEMALGQTVQNEMEQGRKYFYGIRTKKNYRKAFPFLLRAARQGYVHASTWSVLLIETI
jgi:TPR repeat protein